MSWRTNHLLFLCGYVLDLAQSVRAVIVNHCLQVAWRAAADVDRLCRFHMGTAPAIEVIFPVRFFCAGFDGCERRTRHDK